MKKLISVFSIIIFILTLGGCRETIKYADDIIKVSQSNDAVISLVKNGSFSNYTDKNIGNQFSIFFANGYWSEFKADDARQIVEYNGECFYMEQDVQATIQFEVDIEAKTFEVIYLGLNQIPQNQLTIYSLIESVMTY